MSEPKNDGCPIYKGKMSCDFERVCGRAAMDMTFEKRELARALVCTKRPTDEIMGRCYLCSEERFTKCHRIIGTITALLSALPDSEPRKKPLSVSWEFVEKHAEIISPNARCGLGNEPAIEYQWWREQKIRDLLLEAGVDTRRKKPEEK